MIQSCPLDHFSISHVRFSCIRTEDRSCTEEVGGKLQIIYDARFPLGGPVPRRLP